MNKITSFAQFRIIKEGVLCFTQRLQVPAEDCSVLTNKQERELSAENTDLAREKLRQPQDL